MISVSTQTTLVQLAVGATIFESVHRENGDKYEELQAFVQLQEKTAVKLREILREWRPALLCLTADPAFCVRTCVPHNVCCRPGIIFVPYAKKQILIVEERTPDSLAFFYRRSGCACTNTMPLLFDNPVAPTFNGVQRRSSQKTMGRTLRTSFTNASLRWRSWLCECGRRSRSLSSTRRK